MPDHALADSPLAGLSPAELQTFLKLAAGIADLGVFHWIPEADIFACSREGRALLGIAGELGGLDLLLGSVRREDRARLEQALRGAAKPNAAFDLPCRRAKGAGRGLRFMGTFAPGAGDRPGRVVGLVTRPEQAV
jgi:PAS domain-containing protein